MTLSEAFPFLNESGHIVCLVGGGGKTSLMFALARAGAACHMKVIITTTTHIRQPEDLPVVQNARELTAAFAGSAIVCAGDASEDHKLTRPSSLSLEEMHAAADLVLIEADGAKGLPCKVPAGHEPVIPEQCDTVIGVMGMDTVGRRLGDICFRKELAAAFLRTDEDHVMMTEDMCRILSSAEGTMKGVGDRCYFILLNKCDDQARTAAAAELKCMLLKTCRAHVYSASLRDSDHVR